MLKKYMNKEKALYEYIKKNIGDSNEIITNDDIIADRFGVSIATIYRWRHLLMKNKFINCKVKHIDGNKKVIISLRGEK